MRRILFRGLVCRSIAIPQCCMSGSSWESTRNFMPPAQSAGPRIDASRDIAPVDAQLYAGARSASCDSELAASIANAQGEFSDSRRAVRRCTGTLAGGVPISFFLLAVLGIPLGAFWDTATFAMLIGMVVTRAGCFLTAAAPASRPRAGGASICPTTRACDGGVFRCKSWNYVGNRRAGSGCPALGKTFVLRGCVPVRARRLWRRPHRAGTGREEQDRLMGISVHKAI